MTRLHSNDRNRRLEQPVSPYLPMKTSSVERLLPPATAIATNCIRLTFEYATKVWVHTKTKARQELQS